MGSWKTKAPQMKDTKMLRADQVVWVMPSPAFCMAMMAITPFATHIAAPTVPHQVKTKRLYVSTNQHVVKHTKLL